MTSKDRTPFRPTQGQLVEIRSAAEIRATLDADFTFEGLPFMPEMLKYCGRRMRVYRRVNKTCVEGYGVRAMRDTVLLTDSHCDGSAHDGCQRNCLIFWKEAWLAPVENADAPARPDTSPPDDFYRVLAAKTREGTRYICQSTRLYQATQPLSKYNLFKYFQEIADGQLRFGRFIQIVHNVLRNRLRMLLHMQPHGVVTGERGIHGPHSKGDLNLQSGDHVQVKSLDEIRDTVGPAGKNQGLLFEADMAVYAGGQYQVDFPIEKIISEETGEMIHLTHTVALKGVRCAGLCAKNCPRAQIHFWREAWVKSVGPR